MFHIVSKLIYRNLNLTQFVPLIPTKSNHGNKYSKVTLTLNHKNEVFATTNKITHNFIIKNDFTKTHIIRKYQPSYSMTYCIHE